MHLAWGAWRAIGTLVAADPAAIRLGTAEQGRGLG